MSCLYTSPFAADFYTGFNLSLPQNDPEITQINQFVQYNRTKYAIAHSCIVFDLRIR